MLHKRKATTKDSRLVGAFVPLPAVTYLNLYLAAFGYSKSDLLRNLTINWVDEKRKEQPRIKLIEDIAAKEQELWNFEKIKGKKFTKFLSELVHRLVGKGLDRGTVEEIINKLKE